MKSALEQFSKKVLTESEDTSTTYGLEQMMAKVVDAFEKVIKLERKTATSAFHDGDMKGVATSKRHIEAHQRWVESFLPHAQATMSKLIAPALRDHEDFEDASKKKFSR